MKSLLIAYVAYMVVLALYALVKRRGDLFARHLTYQGLTAVAFFMLLPFYWMVISSLKSPEEVIAYPPTWWPQQILWANYPEAWHASSDVGFGRYFWVSISTSIIITVGTLITSVLAAYPFARWDFWGRGMLFYVILATLMVPGQVLLIPNYIILNYLGWFDTYEALVVPWLASVFSIFLMRQFFMTIPNDLWDAGQIDGAGRWRYLWLVIVPLSTPVMVTSGIFNFIATWNSLLWPLVVTSSAEMRTLMVGLQVFTSDAGSDVHLLMAASTFCILPIVVLFFFLQRYFIEGIARSGLKS